MYMDWGFLLGLVIIALLVIIPLIYLGRKFSKYEENSTKDSGLELYVTPTGNALAACLVGFWAACIIAFQLAPNTKFGVYLGTGEGVAVALFGSFFFFVIAVTIARSFGYPIAQSEKRDPE